MVSIYSIPNYIDVMDFLRLVANKRGKMLQVILLIFTPLSILRAAYLMSKPLPNLSYKIGTLEGFPTIPSHLRSIHPSTLMLKL